MSESLSYFQITCVNCESKGKITVVRTRTEETKCHECGAILVIESWKIKYVLTPEGKLIDTTEIARQDGRSGRATPMHSSVVDAAVSPDTARKAAK